MSSDWIWTPPDLRAGGEVVVVRSWFAASVRELLYVLVGVFLCFLVILGDCAPRVDEPLPDSAVIGKSITLLFCNRVVR